MSQLKVDSIIPRGGLASGFSGGIIQTVQSVKTDTMSESISAGGTSSCIISLSITPTATSSKILVIADLSASFSDTGVYMKLFRGSTQIALGDSASNRQRVSTHLLTDQSFVMSSCSCHFLDAPSTTSSTTYHLKAGHPSPSTTTVFFNRSNDDSNAVQIPRGISTLMLMEVTA